ncbi:MAG: PorV/PorQ family protein [bacterium]
MKTVVPLSRQLSWLSIISAVPRQLNNVTTPKLIKNCLIGICLIVTLTGLAYAQTGQAGTDIAVLKAGVGARPLGMGGAFTAIADTADAPYWNAGGLGFVTSSEITTMQTKLSTDADYYYVSFVKPFLGGTFGISWIQVGLGTISQTSSEVDQHNEVQNINTFSYFSNAYLLSYGHKLNDNVAIGLTAKYLTSDMFEINGGSAYGYSLSPGIMFKPFTIHDSRFTIGAKIDELLNCQKWGTGTAEKVPPKARLGIAISDLLYVNSKLAIDISQTLRSTYSPELALGFEINQGPLSFRAGYADSGITAGAGFKIGHAKVDYAFVNQTNLSRQNTQRISLSGIW